MTRRRALGLGGLLWASTLGAEKRAYRDAEVGPLVKSITAKQLSVDAKRVVEAANFMKDLGADSLDVVELIMELEKSFSVTISDAELDKLVCGTVGDAIGTVKRLLEAEKRLERG